MDLVKLAVITLFFSQFAFANSEGPKLPPLSYIRNTMELRSAVARFIQTGKDPSGFALTLRDAQRLANHGNFEDADRKLREALKLVESESIKQNQLQRDSGVELPKMPNSYFVELEKRLSKLESRISKKGYSATPQMKKLLGNLDLQMRSANIQGINQALSEIESIRSN